jgi:hypothetical protein
MRSNVQKAGRKSGLDEEFAQQLTHAKVTNHEMDCWQTLQIKGQRIARQADIKVSLDDGRKVVVLCDGEVFHGPGCLWADPEDRIASDRETALAYFDLGYSVVRYSESEIHDGTALAHFQDAMKRLSSIQKLYRNWCPEEEIEQ